MEAELPNKPPAPTRQDTEWIHQRAQATGFDLCGVARAEEFRELQNYNEWLERGYAGEMKYLEDPRRKNPLEAMPGVRSVIMCALNYNSSLPYSTETSGGSEDRRPRGWISRYAWGDDYHQVLWEKLNTLCAEMRGHFAGEFELRAYADTGPIHERAAAKHAGLGWLGKHTLLINQSSGSWLFLGVILTTLHLESSLENAEPPPANLCGTCTRCIDACPTQAIVEPYVLDASRCISYLTIEKRGSISEEFREAMGAHIFGCDICQDVCPWNRKSPRTLAPEFQPRFLPAPKETESETLFRPDLLRIAALSENEFRANFRGSAIKRTKWNGLVRNACIALGNFSLTGAAKDQAVAVLRRLANSEDSTLSESAQWALSRIQPTKPGSDSAGAA